MLLLYWSISKVHWITWIVYNTVRGVLVLHTVISIPIHALLEFSLSHG